MSTRTTLPGPVAQPTDGPPAPPRGEADAPGGAHPVKGSGSPPAPAPAPVPAPGNRSLLEGAQPARGKYDRELLRGTRPGPLGYDGLARVLADGDPTGLEHVDLGAVNGAPAIGWTDDQGRRQVMTVSSGQWLALAKGRAKFRAQAVAVAQQRMEQARQRTELMPVAEKLMASLELAGDPAVREGLLAMFRENPQAAVNELTQLRMAEKQDAAAAAERGRQIARQHRAQRGELGRQALSGAVRSTLERRAQEVQMLTQQAADPAAPDPTGAIAAARRDAAAAQTALTSLMAVAPVGDDAMAPSPMAVHGYEVADHLIELMATGAAGRRITPKHPLHHEWWITLREMASEASRLSRMLGYTGEFTQADVEAIEARSIMRAGGSESQLARVSEYGGRQDLTRFGEAEPAYSRQPSDRDRQMAEAGTRQVRQAAEADRAEAQRAQEEHEREQAEARAAARRRSITTTLEEARKQMATARGRTKKDLEEAVEILVRQLIELERGAADG